MTTYNNAEEATKGMIYDPDSWPCWPVLPVKQRGTGRYGALLGDQKPGEPIKVYEGVNLFGRPPDPLPEPLLFDDPYDMIAQGWVVD